VPCPQPWLIGEVSLGLWLHFAGPHVVVGQFVDVKLFYGLASLGQVELRIMPDEFARPRLIEFVDLKMPPKGRMARRYYRKIPSALINVVCHYLQTLGAVRSST
jgi:hypothetical protein